MTDANESNSGAAREVNWKDMYPALEFISWFVVLLCLVLRCANGPAVTTDQFLIQVFIFVAALLTGVMIRVHSIRRRGAHQ